MNETAPKIERRSGDSLVQVISHRLESLHGDVGDMRTILRELTTAVTKLAVIEERQVQTGVSLERAFKEIERCGSHHDTQRVSDLSDLKALQIRVASLEQSAPANKQTNVWVMAFVTGIAVLVFMFIASKVGLT